VLAFAGVVIPPLQGVIDCGENQTIVSIPCASFGTPSGGSAAGGFTANPACHVSASQNHVEAACVGQRRCELTAEFAAFSSSADRMPGCGMREQPNRLWVQVCLSPFV
jgi:hypothetical protein